VTDEAETFRDQGAREARAARLAGFPYGEFDARQWAAEFKRLRPDSDEELMQGWFANAIMTGYDRGRRDEGATAEDYAHCPVCGSPAVVRLPAEWADGRALAIVGCGNPWHYAVLSLGDSAPAVEVLRLSAEQTMILRDRLTHRGQSVSEFLGDLLMENGLGRAVGRDYPPAAEAEA
jgi:hypothetical protein